jgi:hypothetical protein
MSNSGAETVPPPPAMAADGSFESTTIGVPVTLAPPEPLALKDPLHVGSRTRMPTSAALGAPRATARARTGIAPFAKILLKLRVTLYWTITSA